MDLSSILIIVNIIATIVVGYILTTQIKSQSSIIGHYKDLVNSLGYQKNISLRDDHIKQVQNNMGYDLKVLQKQNEELAIYVDHVFNVMEGMGQDSDEPFDRESVISNNMPSCFSLISLKRDSDSFP